MTAETPDSPQRRQILDELDRNVLVEAAAGTGKTTGMVRRMVALLGTGCCQQMRQMAAVTFTRKAAAELRARFQVELQRALSRTDRQERARLQQALDEVDQGFVGTIHGFCSRLLRERPVEAGVDLAFEELDDEADRRMRLEAWQEYVEHEFAGQTPGLLEQMDHLGLDLGEMRGAFLGYCDYPDVESWPVGDAMLPDLTPVVEELRDYVAHMRRLDPLLPQQIGTDTLVPAYRDLPRIVGHHEPLDPHQPSLLMRVLAMFTPRRIRYTYWVRTGNFDKEQALQEQARWDQMRELAGRCLQAWQHYRYGPVMGVLGQARAVYDRLRSERGQLNFQDLLIRAAALLRERPHVRRYFAERYTHLLVDEFQDTDPVQAEVLLLLCSDDPTQRDWRRCAPRPGALFVVGDPKQSIYRFRRADIVTYNQVRQIVQDGGGLVLELSTNFRSCAPVLQWVNGCFEPLFPRTACDESPRCVALQQGRVDVEQGMIGVRVLTVPEDSSRANAQTVQMEAERIARTIRHWLDSGMSIPRTERELRLGRSTRVTAGDIMIVTRRRANLAVYARKLVEVGVPHRVTGGGALNDLPELRLLHLCLDALTRPDDALALVALLRSELFGASDTMLYDLRRAGGAFSFHRDLPQELEPAAAEVIGTAHERLRSYERWLAGLPLMAAVEKLTVDLGLAARAAARPAGDLDAGSLAKSLELLRRAHRQSWTAEHLVQYLGLLVEGQEMHDGMQAVPGEGSAVRIMNLHKVKGLEAPVVFLADPTGVHDHGVRMHVDRSGGDTVEGYLSVQGPRIGRREGPLLARPAGWDAIEERERRFLEAEAHRLLYVAATRAGALLVITQRERFNQRNPWSAFGPHLATVAELADPGPPPPLDRQVDLLTPQEVKAARDSVEQQLALVRRPTQGASPARAYARWRAGAAPMFALPGEVSAVDGEFGVEWGTVIHTLLQAAVEDGGADLLPLARAVLAEQGMDLELDRLAVETVQSVNGCRIWQRARRSRRRLTEVPFQVLEQGEPHPTVVRGVIDLVFEEAQGWVLVDYKTDRIGDDLQAFALRHAPQVRLYAEAWRRCTEQPVKELGLLLVREGCHYVTVPPQAD